MKDEHLYKVPVMPLVVKYTALSTEPQNAGK